MEIAQSQLASASEMLPMTVLLLVLRALQLRMLRHRWVVWLPGISGLP